MMHNERTKDSYQLFIVSTAGDALTWRPAVVEREDGNFKWADASPPTIEITETSREKHVVTQGTDRRLKRRVVRKVEKAKKVTFPNQKKIKKNVVKMRMRPDGIGLVGGRPLCAVVLCMIV